MSVLNKDNFLDYAATYIALKHDITVDDVVLKSGINTLKWCDGVMIDHNPLELFGQYDQFMNDDIRMGTGSYYTPYPLAKTMVKCAVYDYFIANTKWSNETCTTLFLNTQFDLSELDRIGVLNQLKQLTIVDIACGSGVFLMAVIDYLSVIYQLLGEKEALVSLFNQISGYDVQLFPLEVFKLWVVNTCLENKSQTPKQLQLFHGDSLLNDISQQYDLVIGNPPYIGEKGNRELFLKYNHLSGYEGRMDLFYFFIYKGMSLLKTGGILSFITTNYFVTADGATRLRQYLHSDTQFVRLINLDECKLFKEAKGMHNIIFTLSKSFTGLAKIQVLKNKKKFEERMFYDYLYEAPHQSLFSEDCNIVLYETLEHVQIIEKILKGASRRLIDYVQINQGIVSGADKVSQQMLDKKLSKNTIEAFNIKKDQGVFVLKKGFMSSKYLKPFYKNSHINPYFVLDQQTEDILYITDEENLTEDTVEWQHMIKYKEVLDQRREVKTGVRKWFALQWYRSFDIFEGNKIVVPQRSLTNKFAYHEGAFYASADIYYLTKGPLKFLVGILNSKVYYFWLYNRGKRKGQQLELYAKPLSQIPIPDLNIDEQIFVEHLVEQILTTRVMEPYMSQIDDLLFRYFELSLEEINMIIDL